VTSSPLTIDGTLYLGGGDDYWYALNQYTGHALWRVFTGSTSTGHYNWSSPAALNDFAYVGVSSQCDTPLVQGQLLRVNMSTHQTVNTLDIVPDGQVGGTIWTTPVVDAARNSVFVTTGNRAYTNAGTDTQPHAEALLAVDATTLAIKSFWSLPLGDLTPDADWGTSPTLFRDSTGRDLVAAANKNGVLYAFQRDNLAAGPVWARRLAYAATGDEPAAGGIYSNGYFDGTRLYYAGGGTTVGGRVVEGSVRALDPRTGAIIWEHALPTRTFGALTFANGMLVVPGYKSLYLMDPATGEVLYENTLSLYGAAKVANGRLYVGDTKGVLHAYTYPSSPGAGATASAARVALARGCQTVEQPAPGGVRVRVTRLGSAAAPARIAVFDSEDCTGRRLARSTLAGGDTALLRVPKRAGVRVSVRSSRMVRLKLKLAQR
jgi:outer membrane protein assembly factor BamB